MNDSEGRPGARVRMRKTMIAVSIYFAIMIGSCVMMPGHKVIECVVFGTLFMFPILLLVPAVVLFILAQLYSLRKKTAPPALYYVSIILYAPILLLSQTMFHVGFTFHLAVAVILSIGLAWIFSAGNSRS